MSTELAHSKFSSSTAISCITGEGGFEGVSKSNKRSREASDVGFSPSQIFANGLFQTMVEMTLSNELSNPSWDIQILYKVTVQRYGSGCYLKEERCVDPRHMLQFQYPRLFLSIYHLSMPFHHQGFKFKSFSFYRMIHM